MHLPAQHVRDMKLERKAAFLGAYFDVQERLASLSLGENSRMLRKSLSGKSEGSRRLNRSEPTGKNKAATAYRTLYADLGTALRKASSSLIVARTAC